MTKKSLSVVIPVLNESSNVGKLIYSLKKSLKGYKYEIIFVDDNSTDNTKEVILNNSNKFIKYYLRRNEKKDLTRSCFVGIDKSKYKNILIMDADLQHNPKYIRKFLLEFFEDNYDFVIGVRDFSNRYNLPILRYYSSILIIKIFSLFLKPILRDPMSGFFIFKKEIYLKNKKSLFGKGYKILVDLFYNNKNNYKFKEISFKFENRKSGISKMSLNVIINIIILLLFKIKNKFLS